MFRGLYIGFMQAFVQQRCNTSPDNRNPKRKCATFCDSPSQVQQEALLVLFLIVSRALYFTVLGMLYGR